MFAKLKKKIDFENNRPLQNTSVQQSVSSVNQNINSSITQAPVHQSAKSQNSQQRLSHSRTPKTSMTEEFNDDQSNYLAHQYPENSDKISNSKPVVRSCSQDNKEQISEHHKVSDEATPDDHDRLLIDDITRQIGHYDNVLECPEILEQFESEVIPSLTNTEAPTDMERMLRRAENRIKTLEAELQEKTLQLEQARRSEAHNHKNELATLKKKLFEIEHEKKNSVSDLEMKCQELSEIRQQLSSTKQQLEVTTNNLKQTTDTLNTKLTELTSLNLENEALSSKLVSLSKINEELIDGLEMMRKEKGDLTERHIHEMSQSNTQVEVAEADRKMLEVKIVDLESKFEEDLKVAREDALNNSRKVQCDLEEQIREKNRHLKKQEQIIAELRKVIQRELTGKQQQANSNTNNNSSLASFRDNNSAILVDAEEAFFNNSSDVELDAIARINVTSNETHSIIDGGFDVTQDMNFKYLKHVILKFFLSREHEALQLIKVVSMLLRFNSEEEKMIKDTLQWRTSWFRSKPQLPEKGQTAIVVPALY